MSFNPRICKRCDIITYSFLIRKKVSIHASVKDATPVLEFIRFVIWVSIHASVKDATYPTNLLLTSPKSFNPRICKRCDSMFVKSFIDDTFKL